MLYVNGYVLGTLFNYNPLDRYDPVGLDCISMVLPIVLQSFPWEGTTTWDKEYNQLAYRTPLWHTGLQHLSVPGTDWISHAARLPAKALVRSECLRTLHVLCDSCSWTPFRLQVSTRSMQQSPKSRHIAGSRQLIRGLPQARSFHISHLRGPQKILRRYCGSTCYPPVRHARLLLTHSAWILAPSQYSLQVLRSSMTRLAQC